MLDIFGLDPALLAPIFKESGPLLLKEPSLSFKPTLKSGYVVSKRFKLQRKIKTLDQFYKVLQSNKSIFARHRMYPTAFFPSWQIREVKKWLDNGWFWIAKERT